MAFSSCSFTKPICATSNPVGSKVGVASTTAKNGGIKKISTVDYRVSMVFLTIIMKQETIVTGE